MTIVPGQGRPLFLPAGELVNPFIQMFSEIQKIDQIFNFFFCGNVGTIPQAIRDIFTDIQIWKQGVISTL